MHDRIHWLIVPIVVACALCLPAYPDTYPRREGIDVQHYRFELTLGDVNDRISGKTQIDVRFLRDGVSEVALDLVGTSGEKGMTVARVSSGGNEVPHRHEKDVLRISLPEAPTNGARKQFTIEYEGTPAAGLRFGPNRHRERTIFSLNWPDKARHWLPMVDHPYDKATSEFIVTAPSHYQVIANGLLQEERDLPAGKRLTHWKQSVPIASWLNAVGVARFAVHHPGLVEGVPLQTWVYPQDRDAGFAGFEGTSRQAMEFFSDRVGPYPYEKLANVQAAGLSGGTEHASAIFYGETAVGTRQLAGVVAHEIAHQWFGNSVTERDWDDVWLSEGFATYFTLLFTEHYSGRDAFVEGLKRSRTGVLAAERRSPKQPVVHDNLSDMRQVLNPLVYQKGGWVLHMLRGHVGTENFWRGVREYYRQYRDANASTDDFCRVMEEVSGMQIQWFFDQWLRRPGSPVLKATWTYDAERKGVQLSLVQTQEAFPFRISVEVAIVGEGGRAPRIEKVEMTEREQRVFISSDQKPASIELDPNTWLLAQTSVEKGQ